MFNGTTGDSLQYNEKYNHNGQMFTTPDKDNDNYSLYSAYTSLFWKRCLAAGNCAFYYKSGWWFDSCFAANLNGKYYQSSYNGNGIRDGIYWGKWKELRDKESQNHTSFKVSDFLSHFELMSCSFSMLTWKSGHEISSSLIWMRISLRVQMNDIKTTNKLLMIFFVL